MRVFREVLASIVGALLGWLVTAQQRRQREAAPYHRSTYRGFLRE